MASRIRRTLITLSLLTAALGSARTLQAQADSSIGLAPATVSYQGLPGSSASQDLHVFNQGSRPFLMECLIWDRWYRGDAPADGEAGTFKERQAAAWTRCIPNRSLLPPQSRQKIRIVSSLPKNAEGQYFAMLYVLMRPPEEATGGNASLTVNARLGAPILVGVTGTMKAEAVVENPRFETRSKFQLLRARLHNTGNSRISGQGHLKVLDAGGNAVGQSSFEVSTIFPGQTREIQAPFLQSLPRGSYQALLSVQSLSGPTLAQEISLQAP